MSDEASGRQEIASRLRLARENAGLTQGQVAKKVGWHRPHPVRSGGRKTQSLSR